MRRPGPGCRGLWAVEEAVADVLDAVGLQRGGRLSASWGRGSKPNGVSVMPCAMKGSGVEGPLAEVGWRGSRGKLAASAVRWRCGRWRRGR